MASNEHSNTQQELLKDILTIPSYPADYSIMEDLSPSDLPLVSDTPVNDWTCKTCKVAMIEQPCDIYKCPVCGRLDW